MNKRDYLADQFTSYRGIFRVQAVRNILKQLLLFYDEYPKIDSSLTDCNIGCKKNIQNNNFILEAILNDTRYGPKQKIEIIVDDI